MELTKYHKDVYNARICPYCKSKTRVTSQREIYGRIISGKNVMCCKNYPKCDSYVGCHEDGRPLGRLASKYLRKFKIKAHDSLDRIWKEGYVERNELYKQLSEYLEIDREYTHIAMFSVKTCNKVIEWADEYYNALNK